MPINPKNKKEEARAVLLRHLGLPKNTGILLVSYIQDEKIFQFFQSACIAMNIVLLSDTDDITLEGADIWITDSLNDSIPLSLLCKNGVVPVIPDQIENSLWSEFNPMKFEWNAFIFSELNEFRMFASLIRAIENMRYPGDKRMLLQNVISTKI